MRKLAVQDTVERIRAQKGVTLCLGFALVDLDHVIAHKFTSRYLSLGYERTGSHVSQRIWRSPVVEEQHVHGVRANVQSLCDFLHARKPARSSGTTGTPFQIVPIALCGNAIALASSFFCHCDSFSVNSGATRRTVAENVIRNETIAT